MTSVANTWVTIGALLDIPDPAAARARARDILINQRDGIALAGSLSEKANGQGEEGSDGDALPARIASANNTFGMHLPKYLEYCEEGKRKPNSPETVLDKNRRLTKHVVPHWGDRDIKSITSKDVTSLFKNLKHVPGSAYQVYAMLGDFFKWAVFEEFITVSPMAGKGSPYEVGCRDRYLNDDEIRLFWRACDELGWPLGFWGKMLLLTCQRCTEVSYMSRYAIDSHYVWTLPAGMTKSRRPHIVFFSDFAKEVFAEIPEVGRNGRVFGGGKLNKTENKEQIDKLMLHFCERELAATGFPGARYASIEHWVFHDLRRTGATIMAKLGHDKDVVHKVLNHADGDGAKRGRAMLDRVYIIHEYLQERQAALQDLGEYVRRVVTDDVER